ncbi:hypothetical protein MBLNU230_g0018t1 [Neophaeotheca triangularis]
MASPILSSLRQATRSTPRLTNRLLAPTTTHLRTQTSTFRTTTPTMAAQGTSSGHPVTILDTSLIPRLPAASPILFAAKKQKNLSFETIAQTLGRDEVACAALFYGQAKASPEDITNLSKILEIPEAVLNETELAGFPDRGKTMEMPPKEPLIYRLYEIVQNYGYAYKGVLNEKFGDGIMSAISFSTKVEKETDEKGEWAVITLRGKWLPYSRF